MPTPAFIYIEGSNQGKITAGAGSGSDIWIWV